MTESGTMPTSARNDANAGTGLRANEQHRTNPSNPGGAEAQMEMPIGPEKDSASKKNG